MTKVALCLFGLLLTCSPAYAARVDVANTAALGVSFVGPNLSPHVGTFNVNVTSEVFLLGDVFSYVYTLSGYSDPPPPSPMGLLSVVGDWGGSSLLSWGHVVTGTSAGVDLVGNPILTDASMTALLGNANDALQAWPAGGLNTGETLVFYVQSLKLPELQSSTAIDSGVSFGVAYAPTPEPGTLALIGAGLVGLYGAVRRRRRAAVA